ncbi:hypothetical protein NDU88_007718 [Pleurodeles waltl]|uniref:Uncharacterized protein n=1 Tax=Pleurodeles waltl TaxID=8319 RepID=A0AAV7PQ34_PLEWA|nr:hypothetical protein NDU88_007718 [Pleurodeles waltl]
MPHGSPPADRHYRRNQVHRVKCPTSSHQLDRCCSTQSPGARTVSPVPLSATSTIKGSAVLPLPTSQQAPGHVLLWQPRFTVSIRPPSGHAPNLLGAWRNLSACPDQQIPYSC